MLPEACEHAFYLEGFEEDSIALLQETLYEQDMLAA